MAAGMLMPASASADPDGPPINANECNDAFCTPGITPGVELGAPCSNTTYYVFGVDTRNNWGRLIFCGSPRRYEPRYFRSPPMVGVKNLNADCVGYENSVAQAPDGMFLTCVASGGRTRWVQGDA
ncbi:hypothetical protein ACQ856_15680 [Mycolicibacterium psychrotolerans]|uniref:hypothetical protein n=1 Tax=Mycolicibacterium psychrotolerans TaxID=216929 RepID=UPI003D675761